MTDKNKDVTIIPTRVTQYAVPSKTAQGRNMELFQKMHGMEAIVADILMIRLEKHLDTYSKQNYDFYSNILHSDVVKIVADYEAMRSISALSVVYYPAPALNISDFHIPDVAKYLDMVYSMKPSAQNERYVRQYPLSILMGDYAKTPKINKDRTRPIPFITLIEPSDPQNYSRFYAAINILLSVDDVYSDMKHLKIVCTNYSMQQLITKLPSEKLDLVRFVCLQHTGKDAVDVDDVNPPISLMQLLGSIKSILAVRHPVLVFDDEYSSLYAIMEVVKSHPLTLVSGIKNAGGLYKPEVNDCEAYSPNSEQALQWVYTMGSLFSTEIKPMTLLSQYRYRGN